MSKPMQLLTATGLLIALFGLMINIPKTAAQTSCASDLFFSEYVEGSGQNKALEIYNGTGAAVDLSAYRIELYSNGNESLQNGFDLSGTIADGATIVIAAPDDSIETALADVADIRSTVVYYNGDDTLLLLNNGATIDSIGQFGFDPGTEFGSGETTTKEHTLVRGSAITAGDMNPNDAFDPINGWISFPQNTFDNLGTHTIDCATAGTAVPTNTPDPAVTALPTTVPTVMPTPLPTTPPVTSVDCDTAATPIHTIQGAGMATSMEGQTAVIKGVVVGDFQSSETFSGFFVQEEDADADGDPLTSEGILVYAPDAMDLSVGDVVVVQGAVTEFFDLTEINDVTDIVVCDTGATVTPAQGTFPATAEAWEAIEGMAVSFDSVTVTELYNLGRYGEIAVAPSRLYNGTQINTPGTDALDYTANNGLNRLILDDGSTAQNPAVIPHVNSSPLGILRAGDELTNLNGVIYYSFDEYRIVPTAPFDVVATPREATPADVGGNITVATFNVLNYFTTIDTGASICGANGNLGCRGADSAEEFERQRTKIVEAIAAMDADVIGLIEIENNASESLADLVDGLNDLMGAGTYTYVDTGTIGDDAIKVGFIYKPSTISLVGDFAVLNQSVDPNFIDSKNRPALAQTFADVNGEAFTAVVNHLKSKGSDCEDVSDPDAGDGQGNCNGTRTAAAIAIAEWLETDPTGSGDSDFMIMGDLNAYANEDPIVALEERGYADLAEQYIGADRYSYVFFGEYGTLDYAMTTSNLTSQVTGTTIWHINSDEARYLDYDLDFKPEEVANTYTPDVYRSSDHDPVIVGLSLSSEPTSVGGEVEPPVIENPLYVFLPFIVMMGGTAAILSTR